MAIFLNRSEAGRRLAKHLEGYRSENPVVLALPRGGVPVAFEIARHLDAPMEVLVVRKLGAPIQPELGIGAVAEGGGCLLDNDMIGRLRIPPEDVELVLERESSEVVRRIHRYRGERPAPDVRGRAVILVDDGIATGGTMRAAIRALRSMRAGSVIVAAPVAEAGVAQVIRSEADDAVYIETPSRFRAVGDWYRDFSQVSDAEVLKILVNARHLHSLEEPRVSVRGAGDDPVEEVRIQFEGGCLDGLLRMPGHPAGIVLFAHGSGSSRFSHRNRFVAEVLSSFQIGTLLFDLLTDEEEARDALTGHLRFDIPLLAERLDAATDWLRRRNATRHLPLGYFGASTGAAAALLAAAWRGRDISAVVSRGGRPDLAGKALSEVAAPTLLIVGGEDATVASINRSVLPQLRCIHEMVVIPGASHLFEEPGALDEVARLAADWFARHLASRNEVVRERAVH